MLSYQEIIAPQVGQCDLPLLKLAFLGILHVTTLKKDPKASPNTNTSKIVKLLNKTNSPY